MMLASTLGDHAPRNSEDRRPRARRAHWPVRNNRNPSFSNGPTKRGRLPQRHLRVLSPVPVNIGGDELQPSHASIRIHVEDDTRWFIAKEILGVGLWK